MIFKKNCRSTVLYCAACSPSDPLAYLDVGTASSFTSPTNKQTKLHTARRMWVKKKESRTGRRTVHSSAFFSLSLFFLIKQM